MKLVHFPFLTLLCWFTTSTFAQESSESPVLKPVVEIDFFVGGGEAFVPVLSDQMWQKYLPDFTEPTSSSGYNRSNAMTVISPSFLFGFRKSYKNSFLEASNVRSSAGIIFGSGAGVYTEQRWDKMTSVTIDSFTIASSGQTFAIDSITNEAITRNYSAQDFLIGVSQRFETNPAKRIGFHYGIDVLFGFSGSGKMSKSYSKYINYSQAVGTYGSNAYTYEVDYEESVGPKYHSLNVQFPLELTLRPFLKKSGWNVISMGFSARPSLQWYRLDNEKGTLFTPWYGMVLRAAL